MTEKIIQLNEGAIKHELKELVRSSVEEWITPAINRAWRGTKIWRGCFYSPDAAR